MISAGHQSDKDTIISAAYLRRSSKTTTELERPKPESLPAIITIVFAVFNRVMFEQSFFADF